MQCAHHLVLVQPRDFAFNLQTAISNAFQHETYIQNHLQRAQLEFESLVAILAQNNISHTVFESPGGVNVPDAVFPNNWFTVMPDGYLVVFPMFAPNRRAEINPQLLQWLSQQFQIYHTLDLSPKTAGGVFLEGTGSIVFDHDVRLAYACESPRTNITIFENLCSNIGYTPVSFCATDPAGRPVYHTNVVMSIGAQTVICCLEAEPDVLGRSMLRQRLVQGGKSLVEIGFDQMKAFCGNVLQVTKTNGELCWLMSTTAYKAFEPHQLKMLEASGQVLHTAISTIETLGGGSLRCMLAGIHAAFK